MRAVSHAREQAIQVPGHPGWQGQQKSTTAVTTILVILALAAVGYATILISDPAPAMKLLGTGVLTAVATGAWLLIAHLRVSRVRVVRARAGDGIVEFGGAEEVIWPLRLLVVSGALVLTGWTWAVLTVPSDRMTTLTLLLLPLVGVGLIAAGARAWIGGPSAHRLTLTPEGLHLRIPRNEIRAPWDEVQTIALEGDRVVVRAIGRPSASWAARDLASDPVLLADIATFYARRPEARAEIGESTLSRLRSGDYGAA